MMKKILISSLLGLSLMMSGCGDTEGEDRLDTQQMLDVGNYAGVILKLEASASTKDDYIALGAAYMGRAGLSLTSIITSMASSVGGGDSAFAGFVTGISSSSTISALPDLSKAVKYYTNVVGAACVNQNVVLNSSQKDICLYIGLASTSSAAVVIDLISGDISSFGSNTNDEKLTASVCALGYAFDGNATGCSVAQDGNVTFSESGKTYKSILVSVNGGLSIPYGYLINDKNQTVLTKNYCEATSFSTRTSTDVYVAGNPKQYACPINETSLAEEFTTAGVLVDVLNDGIGAIGGAATEETQGDIDEFKCEILGGTYNGSSCTDNTTFNSIDISTPISESDIIDYLNSQN